MLLDQDAALRGSELLEDSLFYREAHRRLFRAMRRLVEQRVVIDHVTLRDDLMRRGELDAAGGELYIAELVDAVPTTANLEAHAAIVREKAILRHLIEAGTQIVSRPTTPPAGRRAARRCRVADLPDRATAESRGVRPAQGDAVADDGAHRKLHQEGKTITGVPSGFVDLDDMTSGFQRSDLGSSRPPSMGRPRSAQCRRTRGGDPQRRGGVLPRNEQGIAGAVAALRRGTGGQPAGTAGTLSDSDFTMLARAAGSFECPIWIDDTPPSPARDAGQGSAASHRE
jgi:replicative DNA helicase